MNNETRVSVYSTAHCQVPLSAYHVYAVLGQKLIHAGAQVCRPQLRPAVVVLVVLDTRQQHFVQVGKDFLSAKIG